MAISRISEAAEEARRELAEKAGRGPADPGSREPNPSGSAFGFDPSRTGELTDYELVLACVASWEVARPMIAREFCGGKDPGPWAQQPERYRKTTALELQAAFRAVAEQRASDERRNGRDLQGLGGDSPAGAVDGAIGDGEAPAQTISRLTQERDEARAEAARYKTRLELDHCYDVDGNHAPWPEGMTPIDGIACRDETIKGQDEQIKGLARERNAYREVAKLFIAVAAENDPTKRAQLLDKAERGARTLLSQSSEGE